MTNPLNLCEVIEYVKNIVDSVRCTVCDKARGARVRYSCGHAACDDCLTVDEGCMLCLTPPSTLTKPLSDKPYSQRVQNACSLLNACQDTFNLDVYRKLRVSEQLKAEKELFPECIQAPVKYTNKRKSLVYISNKENLGHTFYPGERISQSDSFKMNRCNNYVQQWLNNSGNNTRKALSDLKINNENIMDLNHSTRNKQKKINPVKEMEEIITGSNKRKRSYSNNSYSLLDTHIKSNTNKKKMKSQYLETSKDELKPTLNKNENDESGIVLDDEPILIEDSQSQVLDKDALALLAVEAAHYGNADVTTVSLGNTQDYELSPNCDDSGVVRQELKCQSVPFLRKSSLLQYCFNCKKNYGSKTTDDAKNVSITIENDCFVTTINVSRLTAAGHDKNSIHVQTDISEISFLNKDITIEDNLVSISDKRGTETESASNAYENQYKQDINDRDVHSPNIFDTFEDVPNKKRQIVIDDSDSDVSNLEVNVVHVTADIHRSCEPLDYGILGEMKANELVNRPRKKVRGATPDSNNSSDKENCDPNKRRKHKHVKKIKCFKK